MTPDREPAESAPPGAGFMNVFRWVLFALLAVLAVASIAGYVANRREPRTAAVTAAWYCPMHPSYTSDRPGQCPICGMDLEPIPAGTADSLAHAGAVPGLAEVHLDPARIQLIGVRTVRAERGPFAASLDLVGFVAPDEASLAEIRVRVDGWVEKLHGGSVGEMVRAGAPLLTLYSPELYQSESEYLIETGAVDSGGHERFVPGAGRERLRLLGVPPDEIERLEHERTASTRMTLRAPFSGTVLERGVVDGQHIGPETTLLKVADFTRVWVLADLYEMDLSRVRVSNRAVFTSDGLPGRKFPGTVEFLYPTVSQETRTLQVRISLANPEGLLRPGMFGRVTVSPRARQALVIPTEAVINTGEQSYVFLAHAGGRFAPREVETGEQDGERTEVLSGLAAGDTVVASASFLIDSESRLRSALGGSRNTKPTHGGGR